MNQNLAYSGKFHRLCAVLLSLSLIAAGAKENVDPKKGRVTTNPTSGNRYTIEQEIQIGRQSVPEVERALPLLPADHPMSKYIASLGQKLAASAPGYKFPYTFKVVREKSVNAFALPGGPIYVHTGLIELANESELAGVMGHEISHVVMRHSTRQATRQMKAQLPLAILGGVLGATVGGAVGSLAQMGMSITAGSVFMKYSRDAETEADMVGAQIMYDAGYDPQAVVSFFNKLKAQGESGSGPRFLTSHPDPGNRAKNVSSILSRFPPKQFHDTDSHEFVAAKKALANVSEESAAQVSLAQKTAVMPRLPLQNIASANFLDFQHAGYAIRYPENWKIDGNADSTSVTIYPEGGSANGTIAYGLMISGFQPKGNGSKELDAALRELMADIEQANPDLQIANSPLAFTLHNRQARKLDWFGKSAVQENGEPLRERVRLIALLGRSNVVLYIVLVAPDADFEALWPTFERVLDSLQVR
ncbi:MAG TPA: M48 family metallopeptidase [Terriglobales bacterium]|nr:M48 family metallopeptidase [Terriglobales bacterium]